MLMVALNAMRLSWLQKVLVSRKVLITWSRVVKQATVQLIFTVVVLRVWKINQFDIHNVFLNKTLNKEVYMQQPSDLLILITLLMCDSCINPYMV
jgi:hypothetical protein